MLRRSTCRVEREGGFTLIELLVVVLIIGILAGIAIPTFLRQKQKGYDAQAKSDTHSLAVLEEGYLVNNSAYTEVLGAGGIDDFQQTLGVTTQVAVDGATGYCIVSRSLSGHYYLYDSSIGRLQVASTSGFPTSSDWPAGGICVDYHPAAF